MHFQTSISVEHLQSDWMDSLIKGHHENCANIAVLYYYYFLNQFYKILFNMINTLLVPLSLERVYIAKYTTLSLLLYAKERGVIYMLLFTYVRV